MHQTKAAVSKSRPFDTAAFLLLNHIKSNKSRQKYKQSAHKASFVKRSTLLNPSKNICQKVYVLDPRNRPNISALYVKYSQPEAKGTATRYNVRHSSAAKK